MREYHIDTALSNTPFACYEGSNVAKQEWKPSSDGRAFNKDLAKTVYTDRVSWLPFAAEKYGTSKSLSDYVIVPVSIILSDIPNRNGRAFPFHVLSEFNPDAGNISYKTWKGKGTYLEHANSVKSEAKGIILDSVLRSAPEYVGNFYTVDLLLGFDRLKDPKLTERIIKRDITAYSMGSLCTDYRCSVCNRSMREAKGDCGHVSTIKNRRPLISVVGDRLAYLNISENLVGFECSAVEVPANPLATSDTLFV